MGLYAAAQQCSSTDAKFCKTLIQPALLTGSVGRAGAPRVGAEEAILLAGVSTAMLRYTTASGNAAPVFRRVVPMLSS